MVSHMAEMGIVLTNVFDSNIICCNVKVYLYGDCFLAS